MDSSQDLTSSPSTKLSDVSETSLHGGSGVWGKFRYRRHIVLYPKVLWQCQRCAMCCTDTESHVRKIKLLLSETEAISETTGMKKDEFAKNMNISRLFSIEMLKVDGKCTFLEKQLCGIYDNRPLTCFYYPFFLTRVNQNLLRFNLTSENCAGLGLGGVIRIRHLVKLLNLATQRFQDNNAWERSSNLPV